MSQKGSKKPHRERKNKEKKFKSKCPDLDKSAHMKKFFKPEDMKVLMSTWEELDNTSSDEEIKEEEEANLCVMVALHRKGQIQNQMKRL